MKIMDGPRVLVSLLVLLSATAFAVFAFDSSYRRKFHYRQNTAGTISAASTELHAASLVVSFEEDLELTRKIIMDHQERSVTVSKEQFIQQMEKLAKQPEAPNSGSGGVGTASDATDLSVPYDAAARLAYDSLSDKSAMSFDAFRKQYVAESIAEIKSKKGKNKARSTGSDETAAKSSLLRSLFSRVSRVWKNKK